MTPANIMASIPADLLRRHPDPNKQLRNVKSLARWLDARGIRPTLAELEAERARRTPDPGHPPKRKARP
jgi:hypothetical protein